MFLFVLSVSNQGLGEYLHLYKIIIMDITVMVRSCLPLGDRQGIFSQTISEDMTVGYFIRKLCKEEGIKMRSSLTLKNSSEQDLRWSATLREAYVMSDAELSLHDSDDDVDLQTRIMNCNMWLYVAVACFLVGVIGLVVVVVLHHKDQEPQYSYGVVLDAGSSHTKLFVYKWSIKCDHETALANQIHSCRVSGGGISSYENDPSALRPPLEVCLREAEGVVPVDKQSVTPVYLGATAGMRLIHAVNFSVSDAIMDVVRNTIQSSKFQFTQPKTQARILTGAEEGLYSWITANYVSGKFGVIPPSEVKTSRHVRSLLGAGEGTMGALDMGGASTQITFYPDLSAPMPENYSGNAVLFEKNYTVYTHSYLCYGINEFRRKYQALLVKSQNFSLDLTNPCGLQGNTLQENYSNIFEAPCTRESAQHPISKNSTFTFTGSGNITQCVETVRELFGFNQTCPYSSSCSFNGTYQPTVHGQFYAFSNFYFEASFLNQTNSNSLSEYQTALSKFCHMTWQQAKDQYTHTPLDYLPWYCFGGTYVQILLTEAYKFDANTWKTLHFVEELNGTEVGWSLGFMIDSSSDLPPAKRDFFMTNLTFALLITLFVLFILISIGFACHAVKFQRQKQRGQFYKRTDSYGAIQ
ncbi:ectonucleoside triphosphate diphosphohydrolase 1-like isoform X2 [Ostrea edulis]|uniref:ectonucleoside triphosphate diphosphohydrolase 1-like isoform X2 n=1 Tax=Ostrea edulis TaxID=37623 RepID=UPI0024AF2CE5|nr:ectonucleoside triphosphate diphosphohydrolase 1-like isoform X2 [Ostrea edulis]